MRKAVSGWFTPAPDRALLRRAERAERAGQAAAAAQLYWQVTQVFVDAGRYEQAVAALQRATQLAPEQADLQNALGQCLTRVGRTDDAAAAFRRAAGFARRQGQDAWADELLETADWLDPGLGSPASGVAGTLRLHRPDEPREAHRAGPVTEPDTVLLTKTEAMALPRTSEGQPLEEPEVYFLDDEDVEMLEPTNIEPVDSRVTNAVAVRAGKGFVNES